MKIRRDLSAWETFDPEAKGYYVYLGVIPPSFLPVTDTKDLVFRTQEVQAVVDFGRDPETGEEFIRGIEILL